MAATVHIEGYVTAERHAMWCPVCCLPSAHEVDLALVNAATLNVLCRTTTQTCLDCGRTEHWRR